MSGKNGKPTENGNNGRDQNTGRFLPGNPGGPGNPLARKMQALKAAILEAGTPEKVKQLLDRCFDCGMDGDMVAARVWLDRVCGKPEVRVELKGDIEHTVAQTREGLTKMARHLREFDINFER